MADATPAPADDTPAYWNTPMGGGGSAPPSAAAAPQAAPARPAYWDTPMGQQPPAAPAAPPQESTLSKIGGALHETVVNPAIRGFEHVRQEFAAARPGEPQGRAEEIASAEKAMPAQGPSQGKWGDLLARTIEGVATGAPTIALAALLRNPALGGGVGSGAQGYADALVDSLRQSGIDMTDSAAVQAKLADPTFMHAAHMNAIRAGVPEAAAGAASFGIMGKLYTPVEAAAGGGLKGVLAGAGAEAGAQGAVAGAGEAGRQFATTGQVSDWGQIGQAAATQAAVIPVFHAASALVGKLNPFARIVEQVDNTGIDHAQQAAKKIAEAEPGADPLSVVKAMTEANVEVGAHYHAAEYEQSMRAQEQAAAKAQVDELTAPPAEATPRAEVAPSGKTTVGGEVVEAGTEADAIRNYVAKKKAAEESAASAAETPTAETPTAETPTAEAKSIPEVPQTLAERRAMAAGEAPVAETSAAPEAEPVPLGQTKAGAKERGSISGRPIKPEEGDKNIPAPGPEETHSAVRSFLGDTSAKTAQLGRQGIMQFEGMSKIQQHMDPEIAPEPHRILGAIDRTRQEHKGYQDSLATEDAAHLKKLVEWGREDPERLDRFNDLRSESTIARVDPSKDFEPLYSKTNEAGESKELAPKQVAADEARKSYYTQRGKPMYDSLGPEGQQLYKEHRDWYEARSDKVTDAIEQRARDLGMKDSDVKDLMGFLKKTQGKITPYFALKRYGDLEARTRDAEGNTTGYIRRDKPSEIKQWLDEQKKAQGIKPGERASTGELRAESGKALDDTVKEGERVAPRFLKEIMDTIDDPDLKAEVYRKYIDSLPEGSYMKSKLPRAGVPGYSNDAIRSFATHANATSRALASLKYAHKYQMQADDFRESVKDLQKQQSANETADPKLQKEIDWGSDISDRLASKHGVAWLQSPHNDKWTQMVSGLAFHSVLGAMPSTAGKILLQNPIWASARLDAEFGFFHADLTKQTAKYAWRNMVAPILNKAIEKVADSGPHFETELQGEERQAVEALTARGMYMSSFTHMMTDAAQVKEIAANPSAMDKVKQWVTWSSQAMFRGGEDYVRKTTSLGAFTAARRNGLSFDDAVDKAYKITQGSHVDYSPGDTPPIMQSNAGKVILMFHKYQFAMIHNLARNIRDSTALKSLPPGERAIAIKTFLGTLGRAYLVGGTHMIPGLTAAVGWIASKVLSDDPDHPVDGETALRNHLELEYGARGMQTILGGGFGAAGMAPIGGLTDLFYEPPSRREGINQQFQEAAIRAGGAGLGQLVDTVKGIDYASRGEYQRALEHAPLRGLHGPLQAERFGREGVRSPNQMPGNETMSPQEVSAADLIKKTLGFTPLDLSERYDLNTGRQNLIASTYDQEKQIVQRYAIASALGQDKEIARIIKEELTPFQTANPGFDVVGDIRRFMTQQATGEHGVGIPLKMRSQVLNQYPETPRTMADRRAAAEASPQ